MQREGRYRILRRLARGGMAEVYEAVAEGAGGFERRVAIKRMLGGADADEALQRMFVDEARIASQLHHANIVAVLDYGTLDGLPFQVLELVDGLHAGELRKRGLAAGSPMSEAIALHVCTEVAHALEHAHGRTDAEGNPLGIVHRDVSPQNVLVSWDGDVKLSDFGIAVAKERTEVTEDGVTKGKLSYMSPEQARAGHVDGRADVFSLGCVLVELITGQSPIKEPAMLGKMLAGEAIPLPELPEDVAAIAERALAPRPDERFESAEAMAEALGKAAAQRLEGDPRSELRAWLATLRPEAERKKKKKGRLDEALLDLELVLDVSVEGEEPEVRSFHSVEARSRGGVEAVTSIETPRGADRSERELPSAPPVMARDDHEPVPAPPTNRRLAVSVALVGVAVAGAVIAAIAVMGSPDEPVEPVTPVAAAEPEVEQPAPEPAPTSPPDDAPDPEPRNEPTPDPEPPPETVSVDRPRRRRQGTRRPEPEPEAPAPASARGVLAIGGPGAVRAEIRVDGRPAGFAPRRLELPVGSHQIVLVKPDGSRVGPHAVQLTERHTALSPARWIVP